LNQQPPGNEAAGIRDGQIAWWLKQRVVVNHVGDDEEEQPKGRQCRDDRFAIFRSDIKLDNFQRMNPPKCSPSISQNQGQNEYPRIMETPKRTQKPRFTQLATTGGMFAPVGGT